MRFVFKSSHYWFYSLPFPAVYMEPVEYVQLFKQNSCDSYNKNSNISFLNRCINDKDGSFLFKKKKKNYTGNKEITIS